MAVTRAAGEEGGEWPAAPVPLAHVMVLDQITRESDRGRGLLLLLEHMRVAALPELVESSLALAHHGVNLLVVFVPSLFFSALFLLPLEELVRAVGEEDLKLALLGDAHHHDVKADDRRVEEPAAHTPHADAGRRGRARVLNWFESESECTLRAQRRGG